MKFISKNSATILLFLGIVLFQIRTVSKLSASIRFSNEVNESLIKINNYYTTPINIQEQDDDDDDIKTVNQERARQSLYALKQIKNRDDLLSYSSQIMTKNEIEKTEKLIKQLGTLVNNIKQLPKTKNDQDKKLIPLIHKIDKAWKKIAAFNLRSPSLINDFKKTAKIVQEMQENYFSIGSKTERIHQFTDENALSNMVKENKLIKIKKDTADNEFRQLIEDLIKYKDKNQDLITRIRATKNENADAVFFLIIQAIITSSNSNADAKKIIKSIMGGLNTQENTSTGKLYQLFKAIEFGGQIDKMKDNVKAKVLIKINKFKLLNIPSHFVAKTANKEAKKQSKLLLNEVIDRYGKTAGSFGLRGDGLHAHHGETINKILYSFNKKMFHTNKKQHLEYTGNADFQAIYSHILQDSSALSHQKSLALYLKLCNHSLYNFVKKSRKQAGEYLVVKNENQRKTELDRDVEQKEDIAPPANYKKRNAINTLNSNNINKNNDFSNDFSQSRLSPAKARSQFTTNYFTSDKNRLVSNNQNNRFNYNQLENHSHDYNNELKNHHGSEASNMNSKFSTSHLAENKKGLNNNHHHISSSHSIENKTLSNQLSNHHHHSKANHNSDDNENILHHEKHSTLKRSNSFNHHKPKKKK